MVADRGFTLAEITQEKQRVPESSGTSRKLPCNMLGLCDPSRHAVRSRSGLAYRSAPRTHHPVRTPARLARDNAPLYILMRQWSDDPRAGLAAYLESGGALEAVGYRVMTGRDLVRDTATYVLLRPWIETLALGPARACWIDRDPTTGAARPVGVTQLRADPGRPPALDQYAGAAAAGNLCRGPQFRWGAASRSRRGLSAERRRRGGRAAARSRRAPRSGRTIAERIL